MVAKAKAVVLLYRNRAEKCGNCRKICVLYRKPRRRNAVKYLLGRWAKGFPVAKHPGYAEIADAGNVFEKK